MRNRIPAHCGLCCAHVNEKSWPTGHRCLELHECLPGPNPTVNLRLMLKHADRFSARLMGRVPPMGNGEGFKERENFKTRHRQGEEAIGKLAQDVLENPVVTGALSRVFETRERAMRAQEVAMGALNLPSASDLERLTDVCGASRSGWRASRTASTASTTACNRPAANSSVEDRLASIERTFERLEAAQTPSRGRGQGRAASGSVEARGRAKPAPGSRDAARRVVRTADRRCAGPRSPSPRRRDAGARVRDPVAGSLRQPTPRGRRAAAPRRRSARADRPGPAPSRSRAPPRRRPFAAQRSRAPAGRS